MKLLVVIRSIGLGAPSLLGSPSRLFPALCPVLPATDSRLAVTLHWLSGSWKTDRWISVDQSTLPGGLGYKNIGVFLF